MITKDDIFSFVDTLDVSKEDLTTALLENEDEVRLLVEALGALVGYALLKHRLKKLGFSKGDVFVKASLLTSLRIITSHLQDIRKKIAILEKEMKEI